MREEPQTSGWAVVRRTLRGDRSGQRKDREGWSQRRHGAACGRKRGHLGGHL